MKNNRRVIVQQVDYDMWMVDFYFQGYPVTGAAAMENWNFLNAKPGRGEGWQSTDAIVRAVTKLGAHVVYVCKTCKQLLVKIDGEWYHRQAYTDGLSETHTPDPTKWYAGVFSEVTE